MDSTPALHWLGVDQWALRVPLPGHSSEPMASLKADVPASDTPVAEHHISSVDSSKVAEAEVSWVEPVPNSGLCFIAASGAEFSALVAAISRCLPSGRTVVHQSATEEQPASVHWDGQTWSLAELRRNGQAKRALWRLLVGSKA